MLIYNALGTDLLKENKLHLKLHSRDRNISHICNMTLSFKDEYLHISPDLVQQQFLCDWLYRI